MMQVSIVDLRPYYGLLKVTGADASAFLQGQLTCDIHTSSEAQFTLGGHCNPKGRLRALFRIYKHNEAYYLQTPLSQLEFAASELKKYAKFSKVMISDESASLPTLGLIFEKQTPESESFSEWNPKSLLTTIPALTHTDFHIVKIPFSHTRYQIFASKETIQQFLASFPSSQIQDFEAWKLAEIREGLPEIWPELREQLLPHHIQLTKLGGVSFSKGCYCGQEIIARMEYRGNIKKTMVQSSMQADIAPLPGTIIYSKNDSNPNPTEMGVVITAAMASIGVVEMLLETLNK